MDLSWWKSDERISSEEFTDFVLHLERENISDKDIDTIEKLFADTGDFPNPQYVIGLQWLNNSERIDHLNQIIIKKNKQQQSDILMVYRFFDKNMKLERVWAYHFDETGIIEERKIIVTTDNLGFWYMCFGEEFTAN